MKKNLLLLLVITVLTPWCVNAQNFPQLSENGTEYWYGLFSHRAKMTLKNNGKDNAVISTKFDETVNELNWKFESTGNADEDGDLTFRIVSKAGGELLYKQFIYVGDNQGDYTYAYDEMEEVKDIWTEVDENTGDYKMLDRFIIVEANKGSIFSFKQFKQETDKFKFQISFSPAPLTPVIKDPDNEIDRTEYHYINMTNHTADNEICAYKVDDDGNPFSVFTSKSDLYNYLYPDGMPAEFSTEDNPIWYQLKNCRNGNVYASAGLEEHIAQTTLITSEGLEKDNQLFRFEGEPDGFTVICKTGGAFKYDEGAGRIILYDDGDIFIFSNRLNAEVQKDKWEITHVKNNSGINETNGSACLYGTGDPGNAMELIDQDINLYENAPNLSTAAAPEWYYIRNLRANRVLASIGQGLGAVQRDLITKDGYESQMFRFEGTYDSFKIICQAGGALRFNENITIADETLGDNFIFQQSANTKFGEGKWGLKHLSNGNGLNMDNNAEKEDEVTLYNISDDGSVFEFLTHEEAVVSVPELEIAKAQFIITDATLTIAGEGIAGVVVYDITGRQIPATGQYTYTLPTAGYYIVSINYTDGSKENTKIVIR